ncbi:MAG TPA: DUF998 domain-containing protein [Blastocatellia bacterium]|nr:DUF998 domain-containing protein [Blastocatellia bacterium]
MERKDQLTLLALKIGIAIPFLYFGLQLIAAPFYPGYSFLARDASTLGSSGSSFPAIFNIGSIIIGTLTLIAAFGFLSALRRIGIHPILSVLTFLALIGHGLAGINAGVFPLPDPRHTDGILALLGAGLIFLPILLPIALWKLPEARQVKGYFIANFFALLALIPIMSGLIQRLSIMARIDIPGYQHFLNNCQGLLQRIGALVMLAPIAVAAYFLAKRLKDRERKMPDISVQKSASQRSVSA